MSSLQPNSSPIPPLSRDMQKWSVLISPGESWHKLRSCIDQRKWGVSYESRHIALSLGYVDHKLSSPFCFSPQNLLTGWKTIGVNFCWHPRERLCRHCIPWDFSDPASFTSVFAQVWTTPSPSGSPKPAPSYSPSQAFPPTHPLHSSSYLGACFSADQSWQPYNAPYSRLVHVLCCGAMNLVSLPSGSSYWWRLALEACLDSDLNLGRIGGRLLHGWCCVLSLGS